ncbi:MAG: rubrerythrin [Clostridia bacterium]|nr:rubrerythrin [Clostridia bacterium]
MDNKNGFLITDRDRVLKAWLDSTEAVRDYSEYANELRGENDKLSELFAKQSESEAIFASKMLKLLQEYDIKKITG